MTEKYAKQGHGDGFCGIYCLANALSDWEILKTYNDWRKEGFRRLIKAAERLNLLDSYHLIEGYEDHELVEIFNFMSDRYQFPWAAKRLENFDKQPATGSNIAFVRSIVRSQSKVIIAVDQSSHWVLIDKVGENNRLSVVDPWPNSIRTDVGVVSSVAYGVVISRKAIPEQKIK